MSFFHAFDIINIHNDTLFLLTGIDKIATVELKRPKPEELVLNTEVLLKCQITGNPDLLFDWYHNTFRWDQEDTEQRGKLNLKESKIKQLIWHFPESLKVSLYDVGQNLKPNSQNIELQTFNNQDFYWQLAFMIERDEKRPFVYYYLMQFVWSMLKSVFIHITNFSYIYF